MHILQTEYIIKADGNSEENQYWLNEGIIGFSYSDSINSVFNRIEEV